MTLNWRNNKFVCGLRAELTGRRRRHRLQNGKVICREWCAMTVNPRSAWRHTFTVDGPRTEAAAISAAHVRLRILFVFRAPNRITPFVVSYANIVHVAADGHRRSFIQSLQIIYNTLSPLYPSCVRTVEKSTRRPGNESVSYIDENGIGTVIAAAAAVAV